MRLRILSPLLMACFLASCYSTMVKEADNGYNYYRALLNPSHDRVVQFLDSVSDSQIRDIMESTHNPYGLGAVAIALQEDRADLLPLLIQTYKADVNATGLGLVTALHIAVYRQMTDVTAKLLDDYEALPTLTSTGQNLLHTASLIKENPVVPILLKRFPEMATQKDNDGNVPLMYVVRNKDIKTLRAYAKVVKKSNINMKNNDGNSPLTYSVNMNYENITAALRKIR